MTATLPAPLVEEETAKLEAADRAYPPLAKDLFPNGVRVLAIQGLPQPTISVGEESGNIQPVFVEPPRAKLLVLLVPHQDREQLALSLQRADRVFVSLLPQGDGSPITPGFTYWDLEDQFLVDREQFFNQSFPLMNPELPEFITP
jgi:hypothetical protein